MSETARSDTPQPEIPNPPALPPSGRASDRGTGRGFTEAAAGLPVDVRHRSPVLAAIFSAFLPGFGNVYNGLFSRGLLNFVLFAGLFFGTVDSGQGPHLSILLPSLFFIWLFGIVDAYRQATLINFGVSEAEILTEPPLPTVGGGLAIGVAVFLIGLYGLLSQFFDFDLSLLFDYWYLFLMAFGGWMIWKGIQDRQGGGYERETYEDLGSSGDAADDADAA